MHKNQQRQLNQRGIASLTVLVEVKVGVSSLKSLWNVTFQMVTIQEVPEVLWNRCFQMVTIQEVETGVLRR